MSLAMDNPDSAVVSEIVKPMTVIAAPMTHFRTAFPPVSGVGEQWVMFVLDLNTRLTDTETAAEHFNRPDLFLEFGTGVTARRRRRLHCQSRTRAGL